LKIAVLGVGLIGGSIGLAARRRLGAEVSGFDPDGAVADKAIELQAIDVAAASPAEAAEGVDVVFCAAPVGALPDLVATALEASGPEGVVTDVGSTKRELVSRHGDSPRFIGGHPLAGAETSGVENARDDLFDGARWFLTPTGSSGGLLYDRLQRTVADMGARPQAIDAAAHDRLMATVSHLPHVLANVLASQAAASALGERERLPEVGPSFRDTTRVAGANPAIWADIFATNSDAVAEEIDAIVGRLQEASKLMRAGDAAALAEWHRDAGRNRAKVAEAAAIGGPLRELRVAVPNRPGIIAELALALGEAGVNIEDMALYPAADMRSGAVSLWVAGDDEAGRAEKLVRDLGHSVSIVGGTE
jgi:prephenate dehydrogenase